MLLALWLLGGCAPSPSEPNVIMLVIDTLRADHLGTYGYGRDTTPHLDRLSREGVRFDATLASSSWSAPSHCTIATGTTSWHHGVFDFSHELSEDVAPVSALFQDHGYATGLFSTHLALHRGVGRLDSGYDHKTIAKNHQDPQVLQAALAWAQEQTKPFFLSLVLMGPHAPYTKYPVSDNERYFTDMPPGGEKEYPFIEANWVGEGGIPGSVQLDNRHDVGFYINRYDRAVRFTDAIVGRFLTEMEAAGLLEHTLFAVTSDHGEGLGDHDCFAHELYLYDFLVRVPWILHFPGEVPAGQTWPSLVGTMDIAPTILGLTGVPVPDWMDGRDWSEDLRRRNVGSGHELVTASYRLRGFDRYMVRSPTHKLIFDQVNDHRELYHLAQDPKETNNLFDAPLEDAHAVALKPMDRALRALLARHSKIDPDKTSVPLSDEVLEELRELGYITGD